MPKALAPDRREAIAADLRSGMHCREAARVHGVAQSTVSKLAAELGISFDRSKTKIATEAKVADMAATRARTSARFLDECNKLLDQLHQPHMAYSFGGKDNDYNEHQFSEPPVDAKKTLITAAAIAFDKHIAQDRHDATGEGGASSVDAWLAAMIEGAGR